MKTFLSHVGVLILFWISTMIWIVISVYHDRPVPSSVLPQIAYVTLLFAVGAGVVSGAFTMLYCKMMGYRAEELVPFLWRVTLYINPPLALGTWLFFKAKQHHPFIWEMLRQTVADFGKNRHQPLR